MCSVLIEPCMSLPDEQPVNILSDTNIEINAIKVRISSSKHCYIWVENETGSNYHY